MQIGHDSPEHLSTCVTLSINHLIKENDPLCDKLCEHLSALLDHCFNQQESGNAEVNVPATILTQPHWTCVSFDSSFLVTFLAWKYEVKGDSVKPIFLTNLNKMASITGTYNFCKLYCSTHHFSCMDLFLYLCLDLDLHSCALEKETLLCTEFGLKSVGAFDWHKRALDQGLMKHVILKDPQSTVKQKGYTSLYTSLYMHIILSSFEMQPALGWSAASD